MIAILGATGTIGRSLARSLARLGEPLVLFARRPGLLTEEQWPKQVALKALDQFDARPYDLLVNAIGFGDPERVAAAGADILGITRIWDERVVNGMREDAGYVFLSSGVVHATGRDDDLSQLPPYTVAKLQAEARHRQVEHRAILDLRIFGYADVMVPIDGTFFLSDLMRSVAQDRPLITSPQDMVRDYAGAEELTSMITCWRANATPNIALDLYTKAPVSKLELLTVAQSRYGVHIDMRGEARPNPTGEKPVYAGRAQAAAAISYRPHRSAIEVVVEVLDSLLLMRRDGRGRSFK